MPSARNPSQARIAVTGLIASACATWFVVTRRTGSPSRGSRSHIGRDLLSQKPVWCPLR